MPNGVFVRSGPSRCSLDWQRRGESVRPNGRPKWGRSGSCPFNGVRLLVAFAWRSELREVVPGDVLDDFDNQLGCDFGVGAVEFRREVGDTGRLGVCDDAGSDRLAEAAESFVDEVEVDGPFGDGLGLDGCPRVGVAWCVASEEMIEGACGRVALGERIAECPIPSVASRSTRCGGTRRCRPSQARPRVTQGWRAPGSRSGQT